MPDLEYPGILSLMTKEVWQILKTSEGLGSFAGHLSSKAIQGTLQTQELTANCKVPLPFSSFFVFSPKPLKA